MENDDSNAETVWKEMWAITTTAAAEPTTAANIQSKQQNNNQTQHSPEN